MSFLWSRPLGLIYHAGRYVADKVDSYVLSPLTSNSPSRAACRFVVPKLEEVLFCKFFHPLDPSNSSQSFQAHIVSTTCDMRATNLVFRDDVFVINEIDAPLALKGGLVKNLHIELPVVGAALLNRARIKVQLRSRRSSSCESRFLLLAT